MAKTFQVENISFISYYLLVTYSSEKPKANFSGLSHVDGDQAKHIRDCVHILKTPESHFVDYMYI